MRGLFLFLFFASTCYAEAPWGKDASLSGWRECKPLCEPKCTTPILGPFAETMIGFHKRVISPADGPRSYHKPNSSQYTLDAMRKYGFFRGYLMGCDRLMRENNDPWIYPTVTDSKGNTFKYNPVK